MFERKFLFYNYISLIFGIEDKKEDFFKKTWHHSQRMHLQGDTQFEKIYEDSNLFLTDRICLHNCGSFFY
jgi:hypothetical protein